MRESFARIEEIINPPPPPELQVVIVEREPPLRAGDLNSIGNHEAPRFWVPASSKTRFAGRPHIRPRRRE
jgi:hypothetical protein